MPQIVDARPLGQSQLLGPVQGRSPDVGIEVRPSTGPLAPPPDDPDRCL